MLRPQRHPQLLVLPLMLLSELSGMLSGIARDLVIVNLVCREGGFAASTSCNAQEVTAACASFNMFKWIAGSAPSFLISVPLGRYADRAGRGNVIAIANLGKAISPLGLLLVQLLGLSKWYICCSRWWRG